MSFSPGGKFNARAQILNINYLKLNFHRLPKCLRGWLPRFITRNFIPQRQFKPNTLPSHLDVQLI